MKWLTAFLAVSAMATVSLASDEDKCRGMTQCHRGGASMATCDRQATDTDWNCPAYVDFSKNPVLCFDKADWPGLTNCKQYFDGSTSSSSSPSTTATSTTPTPTTSAPSGTSKAPSGSHTGSTNGNSKSTDPHSKEAGSGSHKHKNAGSAGSAEGTGKNHMLYYIIGGVCGIVIVAIIFIILVRRSRRQNDVDDIEEMEVPPVAMLKPSGSTQQLQSAQYMQFAPAAQHPIPNPTTPTNRVVQYYQDNAMPSPRVSACNFGGVVQPANLPPKVVHVAPSANVPTFFGTSSAYSAAEEMADPRNGRASSSGYVPSSTAVHVGASESDVPDLAESSMANQLEATDLEFPAQQERHDSFEF